MCGFTGWVDFSPQDKNVLETMTDTLFSRGPDDVGYLLDGPVGLGHRRLSILDTEKSLQPMTSQCGRYTLAFNGEIYNFRELRTELKEMGCSFLTHGDTEVLLQALIHWGEKALSKLSGMFSFAFWDKKEESLLLARDPFGIKPLYLYKDSKRILFASEMKALLKHPKVPRRVNETAIGLYLECQYVPSPFTMYEGIEKLPASNYLKYQRGFVETRKYFNLSYTPKWEGSIEELSQVFYSKLKASVKSMMHADVPVGAFVSGGLDSSVIASLMQQESSQKIPIFSVALNHKHSEEVHAKKLSDYIGGEFHSLVVEPADLIQAMDQEFDEPSGDQAMLPTLLLSQMTKNHVKVVLTGEGADEVLAGYSNYFKRLSAFSMTERLHSSFLPTLFPFFPEKLRKSRVCKAMSRPLSRRYTTIPNLFDREIYSSMLKKSFIGAQTQVLEDISEGHFYECDSREYLDKMLHIDTRLWLSDNLLAKVDRATMKHSIEARVPYLDQGFVEFVTRLPVDMKLCGVDGKFLLKKIADGLIPKSILTRPKWGFVLPLGDWLKTSLLSKCQDLLLEGGLMSRGIFQERFLKNLVSQNRRQDATRLYSLMMLEIWFRQNRL